jgi:hypothetical protein
VDTNYNNITVTPISIVIMDNDRANPDANHDTNTNTNSNTNTNTTEEEQSQQPETEAVIETPVNDPVTGNGDDSSDSRRTIGKPVAYELLNNNQAVITFANDETKLFQCYVNGDGQPKLAFTKDKTMFICLKDDGIYARLFNSYTGELFHEQKINKTDLSNYRKRLFNFYSDKLNETMMMTLGDDNILQITYISVKTKAHHLEKVTRKNIVLTDIVTTIDDFRLKRFNDKLTVWQKGNLIQTYWLTKNNTLVEHNDRFAVKLSKIKRRNKVL